MRVGRSILKFREPVATPRKHAEQSLQIQIQLQAKSKPAFMRSMFPGVELFRAVTAKFSSTYLKSHSDCS
jgi:hypothetical protein